MARSEWRRIKTIVGHLDDGTAMSFDVMVQYHIGNNSSGHSEVAGGTDLWANGGRIKAGVVDARAGRFNILKDGGEIFITFDPKDIGVD